jgi:hypothetical protein
MAIRAAPPCPARRAVTGALAALAAVAIAPASAQGFPRYGDELYEPRLRQPGKDVMWLPTPEAMVKRMLEAAKVTAKDLVYDLGAGEGRIPIAAARDFGARALGIEYDPALAALAAQRSACRRGRRVTIVEAYLQGDTPAATKQLSLPAPDLNQQLRSRSGMRAGTRASRTSITGEWDDMGDPQQRSRRSVIAGGYRRSPALREGGCRAIELTQRFSASAGPSRSAGARSRCSAPMSRASSSASPSSTATAACAACAPG